MKDRIDPFRMTIYVTEVIQSHRYNETCSWTTRHLINLKCAFVILEGSCCTVQQDPSRMTGKTADSGKALLLPSSTTIILNQRWPTQVEWKRHRNNINVVFEWGQDHPDQREKTDPNNTQEAVNLSTEFFKIKTWRREKSLKTLVNFVGYPLGAYLIFMVCGESGSCDLFQC